MMVLNGEEELECEIHVDGIRLEHVSEFKYLGCIAGVCERECMGHCLGNEPLTLMRCNRM